MTDAPRIRIAFVMPSFAGGGAQRVMVTLAARLDRTRFDPFFIVGSASGPWTDLLPADIRVVDLGGERVRQLILPLRRALVQARPDIVFSTMGYVNLAVLALRAVLPRMRFVVREANTPDRNARGRLQRGLYRLAYRLLYARADRVVSPTAEIARELREDFGVGAKVLTVIPNPVDESALRAGAAPVRRLPGAGRRFVAAGRLSAQKAFDRLIAHMAAMPADTRLCIFGEGEERPRLEAQRAELQLTDRVLLLEFEARLAPWLAGADAFLLSSRWEGLPNVVLEALACGTPVIAAREAGGIAELVGMTQPGAITAVASAEEFEAAMRAVAPSAEATLRPSLLPDGLRAERVVRDYEKLFSAIHAGAPARTI